MTRKRLKKLLMAAGMSRNEADWYSYRRNHKQTYDDYLMQKRTFELNKKAVYFELDLFDVMINQIFGPIPQPTTISDFIIKSVSQTYHKKIHGIS